MGVREFFNFLKLDFLPCPGCGSAAGTAANSFCTDCRKDLALLPQDTQCCMGCGGRMNGILGVCSQCLAEPERPWHRAYTLAAYQGKMRELIQRFKFYNSPELARPFGYLLAEYLQEYDLSFDLIIPIPLHISRSWHRGYNQTLLLAEILGSRSGIPVRDIMHKTHSRSRQSGRSRGDRHRKLTGSFKLKHPEQIRDKNILLLDDVFTTGATLHAAAKELLTASPAKLSVLTLARAVGHSDF